MNKIDIDKEKPIFPINIIADVLKVHRRTLRIYDEEKLLSPKRSPKNRRLYSINDLEKGKFILFMTQEARVNLSGIKIIIKLLEKLEIPPEKHIETVKSL